MTKQKRKENKLKIGKIYLVFYFNWLGNKKSYLGYLTNITSSRELVFSDRIGDVKLCANLQKGNVLFVMQNDIILIKELNSLEDSLYLRSIK